MRPNDIIKQHEIRFCAVPPDQVVQALSLLNGIDNLKVTPCTDPLCIQVTYSLLDYTYKGLESALRSQGFVLDSSWLTTIKRALIYFCEEVQYENLKSPERERKTKEIYIHAYEHHKHGDHDDTPQEWREYR